MLAINEARLNETIADYQISISGYSIVRRDRPLNGRNGSGACFYVRSNINYIVRADLISDQLENLSIEIIKPRSKPFTVATWYSCLLYTSPSPRDGLLSRMPSSA